MNFKINGWTLLFALTLGALLFNLFFSKEITPPLVQELPKNGCDTVKIDSIPSRVAGTMIDAYANYLLENRLTLGKLKEQSGVVNPNVVYFDIPKCEFEQMVTMIPGGHIYAAMTIKVNSNYKQELDLIFSDTPPPIDSIIPISRVREAKYWDFTTPCPPTCPTGGGG